MGHLNEADLDVLIAGAGPTGLAAAAEAARFGMRYRIVDKAAHGAEHSQALVVQARTLEQFERYGLSQRAVESGRKLHGIRLYSEGRRVLESSFDDIPGRYPFVLLLPQTQTERLLTGHLLAQGGRVEREVELRSLAEREDRVECELAHAGGSTERVTCAYLIGADGAHSTVRHLLGMPFEGRSVGFDFFLGDLRLQGDAPGDELTVHLHRGNLVFIGRIDETHYRLIVALHDDPMNRQPALADFQAAIDSCGIENLRASDPRWMTAFHVSERRAPAFSSGRVFLAGDATNIHSPIGGQGMNTGIQDAGNLLWKIALVESRRAQRIVLDSYDAERKPVSDALSEATAAALRAATASNRLLELLRDALFSRIAAIDAVQDRLRGAVSEIGIAYRRSPIVADAGGTGPLRAGDRAPDCRAVDETGTRTGVFDLLAEPVHTAIVAMPSANADLVRLARLFAEYADVMQGRVLVDGDAAFHKYYGGGDMLYVLRPDGYIGFRGPAGAVPALEAWASELFIKHTLRS